MESLAARVGAIGGKLKDIVQTSPKAEDAPPAFESFPGAPPSFLDLQGSISNASHDETDFLSAQAASPVSPGGNRMGIFTRRHQEAWHQELLNSGADQCLFGGQPFASFPFGTLSSATDVFITRRKLIPDTQLCDSKLVDMVLEHARREGGVKDVAIMACLHALSYSAGSALLVSLREECSISASDARFLRCLVLAHYANGSLVRASECHAAKYLLQLLAGYDFLDTVQRLFQSLAEDPTNPTALSATYITSILRTISFEASFQSHLQTLQAQHKYMSLHNAVSWLGPIAPLPEPSTARTVITATLPRWEAWTAWRPNYFRLMQWEGGNFTEDQKRRLHSIFELEGPDPTGEGRDTLKDSSACFRSISTLNEDRLLVDQLLSLLDAVQLVPGKHAADLYIFLCVENRNPIDHHLLSLVQAILETRNNDCVRAMHLWFSNLSNASGFNNRMVALTKLLPVLESHITLQGMVADDIVSDVVDVMCSARAEFEKMLIAEVPDNLANKIHAFGTAIRETAWLQPRLTPLFLRELRLLPPQETLHEVLDSVEGPRAPIDLIRRYLSVVICGREGDASSLLASIQGNISFWSRRLDPEKSELAVALENLTYVDAEVQNACRQRIQDEDTFLVRDLLPLIRADTNPSCVSFARILRNLMPLQNTAHDCWLSLLLSLLLDRQDDILVWSAEELPVAEWLSWIDNLRILFPPGEGRISVTDLGFTPLKYEWWDLLASRYRRAIDRLEVLHRRRGNLRWLWFQEFSNITSLLELLMRPAERHSPVECFILSQLQPTPYKIRLICESLSSLGRASATGRMAFESVLLRCQQEEWPPEATQALVASWSYSTDISNSDREGLFALSELLGLGTTIDEAGVAMAQQSLASNHQQIIAMARELEDLRVRLMSEQSAPSRLLEALGVENGRPGSDPAIPDRLGGVVERLGERQWEVCFPLSRLHPQARQALGIDKASRLLLVRISFMRQQPSFCIHFFPNGEGMDRSHGPWYVEDEMPDGRVCWTNPSPLVYLLSRSLHTLLSRGTRDLASIHDLVSAVLEAPAAKCMVCARDMSCKLWRPTVCSDACSESLQRAPIEVRVAGLVSDPPALDLLLTCIYSAAGDSTMTLDLLPGCPFTRERVREVIDSFPALPANARPGEILSQIRAGGPPNNLVDDDSHQISDRELLLSWMSIQFRGRLVSAPQASRIPAMPGVLQFLMPNGSPDRERAFESCMASANPSDAAGGGVGGVTFHGAAVERLWRALTEGLKAAIHGRPGLHVQGVALADEADLVLGSCGDTSSGGWSRSGLQHRNVMLVCELAGHAWQAYHTISDENRIAVRYVLLCPKGFRPPKTNQIGEGLRRSFQELKQRVLEEVNSPAVTAAA